jgi:hypothetical protein
MTPLDNLYLHSLAQLGSNAALGSYYGVSQIKDTQSMTKIEPNSIRGNRGSKPNPKKCKPKQRGKKRVNLTEFITRQRARHPLQLRLHPIHLQDTPAKTDGDTVLLILFAVRNDGTGLDERRQRVALRDPVVGV